MLPVKLPVIDKCTGCKLIEGLYCKRYFNPEVLWKNTGNCPSATHMKAEVVEDKKKLNPIKASKRKA